MLRIRDIMTRQVVTLEPQMTLREAMEILSEQHLSGAPVVSGSKVVGVISAGDLLSFAAAPPPEEERRNEPALAERWKEPAEWDEATDDGEDDDSHAYFTEMWDEHTEDTDEVIETQGESTPDTMSNYLVEDVMSKTIRWLSPDADVRSAAEMMREYGVHRVLVCNRGRLVGLVSAMDIAKAVANKKLSNRIYVFEKTP
jgi:CBS domain-containing protein